MSFIPRKHVTESRTIAKNEIMPSATVVMKGTMITMALTMISPFDVIVRLESIMNGGGGVKSFSHDLRRVRWLLNFKP
jgi:hypothetical protein